MQAGQSGPPTAQQQHPAQQAGGRGCANKPLITEQPVDALASGPRLSPLSGKSCALDSVGHTPLPCHSGHPSPRPLSFPLPGPWSPVRKRRLQWQPRHSSQQCSAEQVLRHPSPIILPGLPALVGQSGDNFTAHSSPRNNVRWGQHTCPHNNTAVLKLLFFQKYTFPPTSMSKICSGQPPPPTSGSTGPPGKEAPSKRLCHMDIQASCLDPRAPPQNTQLPPCCCAPRGHQWEPPLTAGPTCPPPHSPSAPHGGHSIYPLLAPVPLFTLANERGWW